MASFGKKNFTNPVISKHNNDVFKDWYVFFRFKYEGKVYKFKRREGINRIQELNERLTALHSLYNDICKDLRKGWNPLLDPKREINYTPLPKPKEAKEPAIRLKKLPKRTKAEMKHHYHNKGITY